MFTKALLASTFAAMVSSAPAADQVLYLPGMGDFNTYGVYSGYLNIPSSNKMLHYMFAQSQNQPTTDPLVIWFNGGPGCSSLLGYLQEHGPWVIEDGQSEFHANYWSWNTAANMLYIESPAGVGFSYCSSLAECSFDDDTSA